MKLVRKEGMSDSLTLISSHVHLSTTTSKHRTQHTHTHQNERGLFDSDNVNELKICGIKISDSLWNDMHYFIVVFQQSRPDARTHELVLRFIFASLCSMNEIVELISCGG